MTLGLTDGGLLGVLLFSMLIGLWRGLVYEVLSLIGWVAAFVLAQCFTAEVSTFIPRIQSAPQSLQYAVAFCVVFVSAAFAAGLLSALTKKLIDTAGLRPVDRALGGVFGLARGGVLLLALTVILQLTGLARDPWWATAQGPVWLNITLTGLKPLLPPTFVEHLP